MKKAMLFTALLLFVFSNIVSAQTEKGTIWIGGSASYASQGGDLYGSGGRAITFTVAPTVNYFVATNIFLGPAFTYTETSQGSDSHYLLGVGAKVGLAFRSNQNNNIFFVGLAYQFDSEKLTWESWEGKNKSRYSGKNLLIGGGIVFPTAKHAGIVLEGGYNIQTMKHVGGGTTMSGNVITIGLGVIGMLF